MRTVQFPSGNRQASTAGNCLLRLNGATFQQKIKHKWFDGGPRARNPASQYGNIVSREDLLVGNAYYNRCPWHACECAIYFFLQRAGRSSSQRATQQCVEQNPATNFANGLRRDGSVVTAPKVLSLASEHSRTSCPKKKERNQPLLLEGERFYDYAAFLKSLTRSCAFITLEA